MAVVEMYGRMPIIVNPCDHLWIPIYRRRAKDFWRKSYWRICIDCDSTEPTENRGRG